MLQNTNQQSNNPFSLLSRLKRLSATVPESAVPKKFNCHGALAEHTWLIIAYQSPLLLNDSKGLGDRLVASWWKRYLLAFWLAAAGKEPAWQYLEKNGDLVGIFS